MMLKKDFIAKSVRFALIGGAAATAALTAPVFAAEEEKKDVERIQVTGSRIQRTDMENASPISVYTAEDIQKTGFGSVAEFLRTTASTGGFNESATLSQAAGASSVGLKGFGSDYTLILLNGRRLAKNSAGGIFTDINQIPLAAVERIDILPDGASAVYGSDAVAGVINIITKRDYEGISVSARYGAAVEHMDGDERNLSIVAGASNEKTNVLLTIEHFERSPIQAVDREMGGSAVIPGHRGGEGRSTWGVPGGLYIGTAKYQRDAEGTLVRDADGNLIPLAPVTAANGGYAPWADCPEAQHAPNGRCYYDFAPLYQLQPESDRQSLFTVVTHQLTDDLTVDGQFRYTRAYTKTSNAPAPGQVEITDSPYLYDFLRNDRFADSPETADAVIAEFEAGNAEAYIGRRYLDFPNRQKDNTNETFEAVLGADYAISDEWTADFDIGFSRLTNRQIGAGGQLLRSEVETAMADGTLNPFIINDCNSDDLREVCEDLQAAIHRTGEFKILFSSLSFAGSTGLELPGGELSVAAGLDYRKEEYSDRSDPASISRQVIGGAGSNGGGDATNKAVFVEFNVPVLDELEVDLAARYDKADWGASDAAETTYSAKVQYRPTDDLLLRASYGTGFKAPGLGDLYSGSSFGVTRATDTKLCNAAGGTGPDCNRVEISSVSGGNAELDPETSKSVNLGIVYDVTDALSFSIDYWSLKIEDQIGSLGVQEILDGEAVGRFTDLVHRNSAGRLESGDPDVYVESNLQNLTESSATGVIYDIQYSDEFSFGTLTANLHAEQWLSYKTQSSASQPLCDWIGDDADRNIRFNGSIGLAKDDWSTNLYMRWLPGYDSYQSRDTTNNSCDLVGYYDVKRGPNGELLDAGDSQNIATYVQFDLTTAYHFSEAHKVTLGIRNLLDKQPPFSAVNNWPFYSQSTYDNVGRFVYLQYDGNF